MEEAADPRTGGEDVKRRGTHRDRRVCRSSGSHGSPGSLSAATCTSARAGAAINTSNAPHIAAVAAFRSNDARSTGGTPERVKTRNRRVTAPIATVSPANSAELISAASGAASHPFVNACR